MLKHFNVKMILKTQEKKNTKSIIKSKSANKLIDVNIIKKCLEEMTRGLRDDCPDHRLYLGNIGNSKKEILFWTRLRRRKGHERLLLRKTLLT